MLIRRLLFQWSSFSRYLKTKFRSYTTFRKRCSIFFVRLHCSSRPTGRNKLAIQTAEWPRSLEFYDQNQLCDDFWGDLLIIGFPPRSNRDSKDLPGVRKQTCPGYAFHSHFHRRKQWRIGHHQTSVVCGLSKRMNANECKISFIRVMSSVFAKNMKFPAEKPSFCLIKIKTNLFWVFSNCSILSFI